jgi:hypothetical protein
LMLLQGLRSKEVLVLNLDDLLLAESQIRVRGKGSKIRFLPLAPETIDLLDHYVRLERPDGCGPALFVSLKGPSRGARMTPAGLRSLPLTARKRVPPSPSQNRSHARQPASVSAHFRIRHASGGREPACIDAINGPLADPDHSRLPSTDSARCLPAVCARREPTYSARSSTAMKRRRPLRHPMKDIVLRAVDSLGTSLCPDTLRGYHATVKGFLNYLGADYRQVHSLEQLRRDPHTEPACRPKAAYASVSSAGLPR